MPQPNDPGLVTKALAKTQALEQRLNALVGTSQNPNTATALYGAATTVITQTAAGAYTWTCPAGVTQILVECWGAGGGGGGGSSTAGGGGGGGGAYNSSSSYPVIPGNTYAFTVGDGGTGGTTGNAGQPGADTSFDLSGTGGGLTAGGGAGGGVLLGGAGGSGMSVAESSQPAGIPGTWAIAFDDEFAGPSLDTSKWSYWTGANNNVTCSPANVIMLNPGIALQVSGATSGAGIFTASYALPVGGCCEARIWFPGPGAPVPGNAIFNWPSWWTSGPGWPAAGEIDIAESYNGTLTSNYHSLSGSHNGPSPGPAGNWSNSWHTYGMIRNASSFGIYFDGVLVYTSPTDDNGSAQELILLAGSGNTAAYGTASWMKVGYVRAWTPGSPAAPPPVGSVIAGGGGGGDGTQAAGGSGGGGGAGSLASGAAGSLSTGVTGAAGGLPGAGGGGAGGPGGTAAVVSGTAVASLATGTGTAPSPAAVTGVTASISSIQSNQAWTNGNSITITLGNGITQGNLIIACLAAHGSGLTVTPPAGWVQAGTGSQLGGTQQTQIFCLVAGSGDAGKTSFTFGYSGSQVILATIREWAAGTRPGAAPLLGNNFEEGTNGSAITAGNSGGSGQNAFDAVSVVSGGTAAFSSTQAAHGTLSGVFATGATAGAALVQWSSGSVGTQTTLYGRVYAYLTANPGTDDNIVSFAGGSGSFAGGIMIASSGQLRLQNAAFGEVPGGPVMPLGQWFRLEWQIVCGSAGSASGTLNYYSSADSATIDGTLTDTAGAFGSGGSINQVQLGWTGGHASQPSVYLDDFGLSPAGYLGPAVVAGGWKSPAADQTTAASAYANATVTTNTTSSATAQTTELAVAALSWVSDTASYSGLTLGYTPGQLIRQYGNSVLEAYQVLNATGTQSCQATISANSNNAGYLATFKTN